MTICVSIAPRSMTEAKQKLKLAGRTSDIVEVRTEGISDLDLESLLLPPRPKVIITNRHQDEGGSFDGSAKVQLGILKTAMELGAEYVDVEMRWGLDFIGRLRRQSRRTKLIVSLHNVRRTPNDLESVYRKMKSTRADVLKIVTTANDIADNMRMFDLLRLARKENQPLIGLCMGERGEISRILCGKYGGFLTFASLSKNETTAQGQLSADVMRDNFRTQTIGNHTKVFGLIGNPVSKSQGYVFHNSVFRQKNVNAVYVNFLVDNLGRFLHRFRNEVTGWSVTMPFKQEIVPFLDSVEDDAERLGVVNTVIHRRGKLIGSNTDLPAIVSIIKRRTSFRKKRVLVLGTGATSRTMAIAARDNGAEVTIIGRSPSKSRSLSREIGCAWAAIDDLTDVRSDILLNGTSVGMLDGQSLVPEKYFRRGMTVMDAVYSSELTIMLRYAKAKGCNIISGAELFNRQAQLQSKLFLAQLT